MVFERTCMLIDRRQLPIDTFIKERLKEAHNRRIDAALASWRPYFQQLENNNNQQQLKLVHHGWK